MSVENINMPSEPPIAELDPSRLDTQHVIGLPGVAFPDQPPTESPDSQPGTFPHVTGLPEVDMPEMPLEPEEPLIYPFAELTPQERLEINAKPHEKLQNFLGGVVLAAEAVVNQVKRVS